MSSRAKLYATIFWQCGRLPIDEEERHDATEAITGKRSLKECSTSQLLDIIDDFKERGAVPSRSTGKGRPRVGSKRPIKGKRQSGVVRMVTIEQREFIAELCRKKGISAEYLKALCWRNFRRHSPQTTAQASNIITILKSNRKIKPQNTDENGRKEESV